MKLKRFLFKKVKSTNNTAIRLIKRGNDNGIISAEIQTKGKGQRGNVWLSKPGHGIICSFLLSQELENLNSNGNLKVILKC